jgi:hypothetical protein
MTLLPIPKLEYRLLSVVVRNFLFKTFAATVHMWGRLLYLPREVAPCRGEMGYK